MNGKHLEYFRNVPTYQFLFLVEPLGSDTPYFIFNAVISASRASTSSLVGFFRADGPGPPITFGKPSTEAFGLRLNICFN